MATTNVINAVRRFIYDAARRKYAFASGTFGEPLPETRELSVLSSQAAAFKIEPLLKFSGEFICSKQSLPQTRFTLSRFESKSLGVEWLNFLGRSLVILRNYTANPLKMRIKKEAGREVKAFPEKALEGDKLILSDEAMVWDFAQETGALPAALQSIRDREYTHHPLNFLSGGSFPLMKQIDEAWTAMPYFDEDFRLREEIDANEFFWLQELLLFFGQDEILTDFYQKAVNRQSHILFTLAGLRYKQLVLGEKVSMPSGPEQAVYGFLTNYLFPQQSPQEEIVDKLQDLWESRSWPLLRLKFRKAIRSNPHEWLAVYFLAQQFHFVWHEHLKAVLQESLSANEPLWKIFNLLYLCRSVVRLQRGRESFSVFAGSKNACLRLPPQQTGALTFRQTQHKNKIVVHVRKEGQFDLKTDRPVRVAFNAQQRLLRIDPLRIKPPLRVFAYRDITVEMDGYRIVIPLIWQQFYVVFNDLRIRFLRKKDRFQLTLKLPANLPPVKVNGDFVPSNQGRYIKMYVDIRRKSGIFNLQLCDSLGRRSTGVIPLGGEAFIYGTALDSFGLLNEKFRMRRNGKPGSEEVRTNSLVQRPGLLSPKDKSLEFSVRRCAPFQMELQPGIAALQRLWITPPSKLSLSLHVFADKDVNDIRRTFFKAWGFYPRVTIIEQGKNFYTHGDILVSARRIYSVVTETFFGGIVSPKQGTAVQLIWVKPQFLNEFLTIGFRLLSRME